MALHYYAQRQYYKNGNPQTPDNYPYQERNDAEKQFHLLCANAISNSEGRDFISVEYGTIEQGKVERRFYDFTPEPEPTPEPEEEA